MIKLTIKTMALLAALSLVGNSYADTIYQVQDAQGNIILTNIAPQDGTGVLKIIQTTTIKPSLNNASSNVQAPPPIHDLLTNPLPTNYPTNAPSTIRYDLNIVQNAHASTLGRLLDKWRSGQAPIVVAHFGDSHVQTGWQIASIRQYLQHVHGNGGRGMIFPYSIAKTYSQEDYKSSFTGTWKSANSIQQPPKIGVGVSGFVATTTDDQAGASFVFSGDAQPLGDITATIYYQSAGNYRLTLSNGTTSETLSAPATHGSVATLNISLPASDKNLNLSLHKIASGGAFELHGINLQRPQSGGGVLYHNLGVGGATFTALLQQAHFEATFATLNADLVVLDWGTNDILYRNAIPEGFADTVRKSIRRIRAVNPHAAIVLKSVQEAHYKGKNINAAADLAHLLAQIAQQEGVLFYDWYAIAGGEGSVVLWRDAGFASKDAIHLNAKGYRLQGQLFAEALTVCLNQLAH